MKMKIIAALALTICFAAFLVACDDGSGEPELPVTAQNQVTPRGADSRAAYEYTGSPTATPVPPTNTPVPPTNTAVPTNTPYRRQPHQCQRIRLRRCRRIRLLQCRRIRLLQYRRPTRLYLPTRLRPNLHLHRSPLLPLRLNRQRTATPIPPCTVIAPGADLRKCHFESRNFSGLNLTGADLSGATLVASVFTDTILIDAKFVGANLTGADFVNADLSGADLSGADARHAKFKDANLDRATVVGTQFRSGTSADDAAMFRGTTLTHIVFDAGSKLTEIGFINADLSFSHFIGVDLQHADLRNATLLDTDFSGADLSEARMRASALTEPLSTHRRISKAPTCQGPTVRNEHH